ncbi:Di-copper centre-containing protein [Auricularia subglabra TFB-10046 SS5]|nr:Di-copper centre-containing protein [Auricularia subglabra TFB-10046 SS5]
MAYVITGLEKQGTFPRRELRDLHAHPEQWTLFVLAYAAMQDPKTPLPFVRPGFTVQAAVPEPASWLQIGGIHGLPYDRWPGDPASGPLFKVKNPTKASVAATPKVAPTPVTEPVPGDEEGEFRYGGYCNHASVLFPMWHRPYVMATEQAVCNAAIAIAEGLAEAYPGEAAKWKKAGNELRLPFWDWTLKETKTEGLPSLMKDATLQLHGPGGKMFQFRNPLAKYHFGDTLPDGFANIQTGNQGNQPVTAYFADWRETVRWPKPAAGAKPTDDYASVDAQLKSNADDLRRKVANLFAYNDNVNPDDFPKIWDEFSNTTVQSDPNARGNSIEGPHNNVHIFVGGNGHMGQNDYAGFDPAFWMHHCNVDRILALWEYCYPEVTVGAGYKDKDGKLQYFTQPGGGTFYQLDSSRLDAATDMLPFRKTLNSYWTTNDSQSLEVRKGVWPKYYTYPAVAGVKVDQPATMAERIKARKALQAAFGLGVVEAHDKVSRHPAPIFRGPVAQPKMPSGRVLLKGYRHIVLGVALAEHAFNDSYTFVVTLAGTEFTSTVAVLTRSDTTACAQCHGRRANGSKVRGTVHIPSEVVAEILGGDPNPDEEEDIRAVEKAIRGKLVGRHGEVLATAEGANAPVQPPSAKLEARVTPIVTFWTALASQPEDIGSDGPVSLHNYHDHGEVFPGGWKKAVA